MADSMFAGMLIIGGIVLYGTAALPGIGLIWWLLRRSKIDRAAAAWLIAVAAAVSAPSLVAFGHMPLILPFSLSPILDNSRGAEFFVWNAMAASVVFLVALALALRSNNTQHRTRNLIR